MNSIHVDIYNYSDFEDDDFINALSDLQKFGVNEDELNLNYHSTEDHEHSN